MVYISARNDNKKFSFSEIFLKGLADDGGLFIPLNIKKIDERKMNALKKLSYIENIYPLEIKNILDGQLTKLLDGTMINILTI